MEIDTKTFRNLMGHFVTGVTVITTEQRGWLHGMTANAVTAVSLDPLLLLVCIDKEARCHRQLIKAGRFGVNILTAEQQEISTLFAEAGDPEKGQLRGVPFHMGPHGTPLLDDCLAYLECGVADRLAGGDHDIFLGEVLGGELTNEAPPLVFYKGSYRTLAQA